MWNERKEITINLLEKQLLGNNMNDCMVTIR